MNTIAFHITMSILLFSLSEFTFAECNLEDIKSAMIQGSIASYSGVCPCPYNIKRNGELCDEVSAYSKPGGATPYCYPQDITDDKARANCHE